jgi:phosphomannomutase
MEILSNSPLDVDQQFAVLPDSVNTPELKIRVEEAEKFSLMAQIINTWRFDNGENILIDGLRFETERAWGLIRASNTSPYLVTRFEGQTLADMQYVQQLFRTRLLDMAPHLTLPF